VHAPDDGSRESMSVPQKLSCVVERIVEHGDHVYSLVLRPERLVPRFRAGQFLHLALDPYDPSSFWPDSRAFSIASSARVRDCLKITYAVNGRFTARLEREAAEGRRLWVKMPFGDFVIDGAGEVALFAGGTGITAFSAFLEDLDTVAGPRVTLAYGARTADLLVYGPLVGRCAERVSRFQAVSFVEHGASSDKDTWGLPARAGRLSAGAIWDRIDQPMETVYYIAGPPQMLADVKNELLGRRVPPEMIRIDNWE